MKIWILRDVMCEPWVSPWGDLYARSAPAVIAASSLLNLEMIAQRLRMAARGRQASVPRVG